MPASPPSAALGVFRVQGRGAQQAKQIMNDAKALEETGEALLPGAAFGEYGGGYLRLSYANSVENIEQAIERMAAVLA